MGNMGNALLEGLIYSGYFIFGEISGIKNEWIE